MKRLTDKEVKELKTLKREIVATSIAVEQFVKSSKDKARQALGEAILCGKAFTRVKEIVGHGGFMRWCKVNCNGISHDTVNNYLRVSKSEVVRNNLSTGIGLKEAYIMLGILKEEDDEGSIKTTRPLPQHTTPASVASVAAHSVANAPTINQADAMSRARYLTSELLLDLNNTLQSKRASLKALEATTLTPIQEWFAGRRK